MSPYDSRDYRSIPGTPWLRDMRPRRTARCVVAVGIVAFLVGAIGPHIDMAPWLGGALLVSGVFAVFGGGLQWLGTLGQPATKVCPECFRAIPYAALVCGNSDAHGRAYVPLVVRAQPDPHVVNGCHRGRVRPRV